MLRFLKVGAPLKKTVKSFLNRPLRCHNQTQYEFSFVRGYASWWKGSGDGDDNDNDDGDDGKKNDNKKDKAENYKKVVRRSKSNDGRASASYSNNNAVVSIGEGERCTEALNSFSFAIIATAPSPINGWNHRHTIILT